ncbi:MAG TPA: serine/threonine-protein kinase [Thermoleophilaceae bacterium]
MALAPPLGMKVGRYRIEAEAGRGGMGVVYRARDPQLDRVVALKVIAPELASDSTFRARFARESQVTAGLDHPNVIPVYDAGEDDGRLFIAMRFVEGTDLQRVLRERGALEPALAVELISQAASALDAAHARGLVHRDVKPANLLIAGEERPHVYLTDFGLAKRDGSSGQLTSTGGWLGTPDYSSPEQGEGRELGPASDVYSLGCVLYAALTGAAPFADVPRAGKGWAHMNERPPRLRDRRPELPAALEPVLARALAKDSRDRHHSAGELARAAQAAIAGGRTRTLLQRRRPSGPSTARTTKLVTSRRRRRVAPALAALVLFAAAGLAAILLLPAGGGSSDAGERAAKPAAPRPAPTPAANPVDTVSCAATECTQNGEKVITPIEGQTCGSGERAGSWSRIEADGAPMFACVADSPPAVPGVVTMPHIEGAQLDKAEDYLDSLGLDYSVSGGGMLGVIIDSNYTVCATAPGAGSAIQPGSSARLFAEHSC